MQTFTVAQFVYVKIETDSGLHGLGEASLGGTHASASCSIATYAVTA